MPAPNIDIVLMKLVSPFTLNKYVKPACLPNKAITPDSKCYASGWGLQRRKKAHELNQKSNKNMRQKIELLNAVDLRVLDSVKCEKSFDKELDKPGFWYSGSDGLRYDAADKLIIQEMFYIYNKYHHICVEAGEKSPCVGDSGGPLICEGNFEICSCWPPVHCSGLAC